MFNRIVIVLFFLFISSLARSETVPSIEARFTSFINLVKKAANSDDISEFENVFYQDDLLLSYRYSTLEMTDLEIKESIISQAKNYFLDTDYLEIVEEKFNCKDEICVYTNTSRDKDPVFQDLSISTKTFMMKDGGWIHHNKMYPTSIQFETIDKIDKYYTLYYAFNNLNTMNVYVNDTLLHKVHSSGGLRLFGIRKGVNTIKILLDNTEVEYPNFNLGLSIAFVDRKSSKSKMNYFNLVGKQIIDGYVDKDLTAKVKYIEGGLEYKFDI